MSQEPSGHQTSERRTWFVASAISVGVALVALAAWLFGLRWRAKRRAASTAAPRVVAPLPVHGLTEEEAAARHTDIDLDALLAAEHKRFLRAAIRHNLFTLVNINLFAIAIIMLLLDSPLSTLGTLFVLFLNIVLNVFQEMTTKKRLDQLVLEMRPQATVIREGKLKSIDSLDVVQGDVLVVGPGDSILVDGEIVGDGKIVVDEPYFDHGKNQAVNGDEGAPGQQTETETTIQAIKVAGDSVQTSSFCVSGRALYEATAHRLVELVEEIEAKIAKKG